LYFTPEASRHNKERFVIPPEKLEYREIKAPKKFKVVLNSIEFDERSQRFTAQLDLEWDGTLPNPSELKIDIGIITKQKASFARSIHDFTVMHPFKDGSMRTIDIGWKDEWFTRFNREPEYFAYAEIQPEDEMSKLLYVERNFLVNSVPLKIVPNKKNKVN
jgi:hypothetical protein